MGLGLLRLQGEARGGEVMEYRFVKKVVTDRHNSEYAIYYTEGSAGGVKWGKIKGTQTGSLEISQGRYLDLVNPPTVTTEVLATEEVK